MIEGKRTYSAPVEKQMCRPRKTMLTLCVLLPHNMMLDFKNLRLTVSVRGLATQSAQLASRVRSMICRADLRIKVASSLVPKRNEIFSLNCEQRFLWTT